MTVGVISGGLACHVAEDTGRPITCVGDDLVGPSITRWSSCNYLARPSVNEGLLSGRMSARGVATSDRSQRLSATKTTARRICSEPCSLIWQSRAAAFVISPSHPIYTHYTRTFVSVFLNRNCNPDVFVPAFNQFSSPVLLSRIALSKLVLDLS